MNSKKIKWKRIILIIVGLIALSSFLMPTKKPPTTTYNEFLTKVDKNQVESVEIAFGDATFTYKDKEGKEYKTDNPKTENFKEELLKKNVDVAERSTGIVSSIIANILSLLFYLLLFSIIMKKIMPQTDSTEVVTSVPNVNFDNIAGHKELKNDLSFIIKYLKNPKKYLDIGARMPKGIILCGPPGTGKTLTAKAIAGTAGVPFFYMSGSDFVELYVGNGAKKVRKLYKKAKEVAPCIVFIDEIDAVGGDRDGNSSHDERRQTVNALLGELDGFSGVEGVLTIAATNKLEMLDPALVRPGRFDKQIIVPLPEKEDRLEILKVHAKGKIFNPNINWEEIAAMTVNFSGAAIEAMLNEAAFIAANLDKKEISFDDVDRAFYKMVMKGDKKENQSSRDKKELEIVAWHEAGHALATKLITNDSVPKVTIIASTSGAGGVTFRTPQDSNLFSKKYMKSLIKVMYSGRIAESLLLKSEEEVTTGASNDIKQATLLIKDYISSYGMDDDIGLINLSMFKTLDDEILIKKASDIAKELYNEAEKLLYDNYEKLSRIANKLLEKETISEAELDAVLKSSIIVG